MLKLSWCPMARGQIIAVYRVIIIMFWLCLTDQRHRRFCPDSKVAVSGKLDR